MKRNLFRAVAAGIVAAALFAAPVPASARVTVSVEFAYGGIVVGGVGIFVYFAGEWEALAPLRELPTALLEVSGRAPRLGLPLPAPRVVSVPDGLPEVDGISVDLLRWRF